MVSAWLREKGKQEGNNFFRVSFLKKKDLNVDVVHVCEIFFFIFIFFFVTREFFPLLNLRFTVNSMYSEEKLYSKPNKQKILKSLPTS